jgi:large subunit ribosomal protein L25
MAEITLAAETGRTTGSRASGRLRGVGKVPATVYGLGNDPVAVAVEWRDLRHALTGEAGLNALINLEVDGHASELTIVKEMQRHPIKRSVLHIDFLRVSRDVAIEVEVPIVLVGEAEHVTREGGTVDQALFHLTISAKPGSIPNELTADISELTIGGAVRVGDLALPEGVETDVDAEEPVVIGSAPHLEAVEGEGAEGEGAEGEGAEGAAADDAGDSAPSEDGGGE